MVLNTRPIFPLQILFEPLHTELGLVFVLAASGLVLSLRLSDNFNRNHLRGIE